MVTPFHRLHAYSADECRACIDGYPLPCRCGGEIHAEMVASRLDERRLIIRCSECGPRFREWPEPPSGRG